MFNDQFDNDDFDRDFKSAQRTFKIFQAIVLIIIFSTFAFAGIAVYKIVNAGPEGTGEAIGKFMRSINKGYNGESK